MIDTHCHLDMPAFDDDRESVWQRAREAGVRAVILPGVDPGAGSALLRSRSTASASWRWAFIRKHSLILGPPT